MRKRVIVGSTIAAICWAGYYRTRRWWATWGVDSAERDRALPGDGLVPEPTMSDTRGITIAAPPSAVWPWIVQLGYGRGGWYSYDRVDMRGGSADEIRPEWQQLAVGDVVPTDPDGGFEVRALEPGRALVLTVDNELVARQRGMSTATDGVPVGLATSGRFMQASMPSEFAVSWAFVLEPLDGDRTRLIERVRGRFGQGTPATRALGPLLGFGVFLMTQRQMVGIRERAEAAPHVVIGQPMDQPDEPPTAVEHEEPVLAPA